MLGTCWHIGKIGQDFDLKDIDAQFLLVRILYSLSNISATRLSLQDLLYESAKDARCWAMTRKATTRSNSTVTATPFAITSSGKT
jgi:hypothetical protein